MALKTWVQLPPPPPILCVNIIMDNETIAIIIIFGTPLVLMFVGAVWWTWKDKNNLD